MLPRVEPVTAPGSGGAGAGARRARREPSSRGGALDASAAELEIDGLRAVPRGRARLAHPLADRGAHRRDAGAPAGGGRSTPRPLVVLDPSRPRRARRRSTGRCAPRRRCACTWRARGRLRAAAAGRPPRRSSISHDLRGWPALHARLALVEAGAAPAASALGPARRRGDLGHAAPAAALAARRSSALPAGSATWSRPVAIAGRAAPRSRWPAAPATWSSGMRQEGGGVSGARPHAGAAPLRTGSGTAGARARGPRSTRDVAGRSALVAFAASRGLRRAPTGLAWSRTRRSAAALLVVLVVHRRRRRRCSGSARAPLAACRRGSRSRAADRAWRWRCCR